MTSFFQENLLVQNVEVTFIYVLTASFILNQVTISAWSQNRSFSDQGTKQISAIFSLLRNPQLQLTAMRKRMLCESLINYSKKHNTKIPCFPLFTYDLDKNIPFSRSVIKIHKDNLLPGTQRHFPFDQWNC